MTFVRVYMTNCFGKSVVKGQYTVLFDERPMGEVDRLPDGRWRAWRYVGAGEGQLRPLSRDHRTRREAAEMLL